jgi:hypothetical protein
MLSDDPSTETTQDDYSAPDRDPSGRRVWAVPVLTALGVFLLGAILVGRMTHPGDENVTIAAAPRTSPARQAGIPESETMPSMPATPQLSRYAASGAARSVVHEPEVVITPDVRPAQGVKPSREPATDPNVQPPDPLGPYTSADEPGVPAASRSESERSNADNLRSGDPNLVEREAARRSDIELERRQAAETREAERAAARMAADIERQRERQPERQARLARSEAQMRMGRRERAAGSAHVEASDIDEDLRKGREVRNRYREFFNEQDFGDQREGRDRRERF